MSITALGAQPYPTPALRPLHSSQSPDSAQDSSEHPKAAPDMDKYVPSDEEPYTEKCTANTDKVDAEIEKLKREKNSLRQQIRQAAEDPEKRAKLEQKLWLVEMELNQKDNDAYRKQHAVYSKG